MADNDVSKLRVALSKISEYTKSAAGKLLPVVVRISQDSKKASWKPDKAPNWWVEGQVIEESNVDGQVPEFGPVKNMKIDGIKAALAAFYLARIHFEEHVRENADDAILEESTDGKNPFSWDHYVCDQEEEAEADDEGEETVVDEEDMADEQPENEEEDEDDEQDALVKEEKDDEEDAKQEEQMEDDVEDDDIHEKYNVKELKKLVAKLKRDEPVTEMFEVLRKRLVLVMAAEKARSEWTVHDEEYKLTLGYHTCCAKLLVDVEQLKRDEAARFASYEAEMLAQCEKDIARLPEYVAQMPTQQVQAVGPVKGLDDCLARLAARKALLGGDSDEEDEIEKKRVVANSRRPRARSSVSMVDTEAGFATPVVSTAQKKRIATAASRSLKNGTPQRALTEDEIDYDQDGNAAKVSLFTASGSPVLVDAAIFQKATRPRRKGTKPPPTPATTTTTATSSRRSKRNKR